AKRRVDKISDNNTTATMEIDLEKEFSDLKISRYDYDEFYDFRKIGESRFGMTVYKSKWRKRNIAVTHKSVKIDIIQNDSTKIDTIQDNKTKITIQKYKAFQEFITEVCQNLFNWYRIFDFDPECLNEEELKIKKAFLNKNKTEILDPIKREHHYTSKVINTRMISEALKKQS
ncbi:10934_t:CDS:2, partial [Dentiscutata heterogama]